MNQVESRVIAIEGIEDAARNASLFSANMLDSNLTESSTDPSTTVSGSAADGSSITPNMTVIGTMVKTVLTMQNITDASQPAQIDHAYYIYLWALGILGCIVLTTTR